MPAKKKVPFPNPNVTKIAGRAVDPISNQPMIKGQPVPAQSMSKAAQFGRQLGTALEPGFDAPKPAVKKKAKGK